MSWLKDSVQNLKAGLLSYGEPRSAFYLQQKFEEILGLSFSRQRFLNGILFVLPSFLFVLLFAFLETSLPLQWAISHNYAVVMQNLQAASWGMLMAKSILALNLHLSALEINDSINRQSNRVLGALIAMSTALLFIYGDSFAWTLILSIMAAFVLVCAREQVLKRFSAEPLVFVLSLMLASAFGLLLPEGIVALQYHSDLVQEAYMTPSNFAQGVMWSQWTVLGIWAAPVYWFYSLGMSAYSLLMGMAAVMALFVRTYVVHSKFGKTLLSRDLVVKTLSAFKMSLAVLLVFSLLEMTLVLNWRAQAFFVALFALSLTFLKWHPLKVMWVALSTAAVQIFIESWGRGAL